MSKSARYEWLDQQAALSERLKAFLRQPGEIEMAAMVDDLREYAESAKSGRIEIPVKWIAYD